MGYFSSGYSVNIFGIWISISYFAIYVGISILIICCANPKSNYFNNSTLAILILVLNTISQSNYLYTNTYKWNYFEQKFIFEYQLNKCIKNTSCNEKLNNLYDNHRLYMKSDTNPIKNNLYNQTDENNNSYAQIYVNYEKEILYSESSTKSQLAWEHFLKKHNVAILPETIHDESEVQVNNCEAK